MVPIDGAKGTLMTASNYMQFYGGIAGSLQGENIQVGPEQHSYTVHEPYGVVGVITPWNAPLNRRRSIVPALAAGNCVVHKPSEYTRYSSVAELASSCGLPKGSKCSYWQWFGNRKPCKAQRCRKSSVHGVSGDRAVAKIGAEKWMPVTRDGGQISGYR